MATWDVVSVASDIAGAGTPLAGLILVYLGAVAVRYETLDYKAQASARDVYRRHARRAFRGVVLALGGRRSPSSVYNALLRSNSKTVLPIGLLIVLRRAFWDRLRIFPGRVPVAYEVSLIETLAKVSLRKSNQCRHQH